MIVSSWTASDGGGGCGVGGMCVCVWKWGVEDFRGWWQWILLILNLMYICCNDFPHILSNLSQKSIKCCNYICSKDFFLNFAEWMGIRGTSVLLIKVLWMASDFFSEHCKEDHEKEVMSPITVQGHNSGHLSHLEDLKKFYWTN